MHPVLIDGSNQMGGRLRGGAQFLRASDPRLQGVTSMLAQQGLLLPWKGRFGVLGSSGGGFLPAKIVTGGRGLQKGGTTDDDDGGSVIKYAGIDDGDFCHFVEGSEEPTYVGVPSLGALCPEICKLADIERIHDTQVVDAAPVPDGGWKLAVQSGSVADEPFDALVLATQNPSLASGVVRNIVNAEVEAGGFASVDAAVGGGDSSSRIIHRLVDLADSLQRARDEGRVPTYTISATYPAGFSENIPFDAVSVPGSSILQFLVREASKPGAEDSETWKAISTASLAVELLSRPELSDQERISTMSTLLSDEIARLLGSYHKDASMPVDVSCKRWSAAFCAKGLKLKEASVSLAPWRLGICGDYIMGLSDHTTPLEAAALSGLEAGERTASLFSTAP